MSFLDDDAERVAAYINGLTRQRRNLSDRDMLRLQQPTVQLEHRIKLVGAAGYAWFFTINGVLDHHSVAGCLYRDSCCVIMANHKSEASTWAADGLKSTLEELQRYWLTNELGEEMPGTIIETGGRKAGRSTVPLANRDPEYYEFLRNRFSVKGKRPN